MHSVTYSCWTPFQSSLLRCPFGGVCWGGDGFDANVALCPAGIICVKPYRGSYFRRLLEEYDLALESTTEEHD